MMETMSGDSRKVRRVNRELILDVLRKDGEASLADLATLSYPPVTKSCLNYRLKKLMEFHMDD